MTAAQRNSTKPGRWRSVSGATSAAAASSIAGGHLGLLAQALLPFSITRTAPVAVVVDRAVNALSRESARREGCGLAPTWRAA